MSKNKKITWSQFKPLWNGYLRASLLFPFGLAILLISARAGNLQSRVALVEARQILFGVRFNDDSFVTATPRELQELFAFSTNDPGSIDLYRPRIAAVLNRQSMQGKITDFDDWASDVTQTFSGFGGRACGEYEDLPDAIGKLAHGQDGCCSDHTMVFLAIAAFDGVFARELHNAEHTFVEYWNPNAGGFIWLDPYLGLRTLKNGKHLSLADMLELIDHHETWEFEVIGAANPVRKIDLRQVKGLKPGDFTRLGMTLGNDVYAEDLATKRIRSLSRPFAQALLLIEGKKPTIGFSYARLGSHRPAAYYYGYLRFILILQAIITCMAVYYVSRDFIRRNQPARPST